MKLCYGCNREMPDGTRHCSHCGTLLQVHVSVADDAEWIPYEVPNSERRTAALCHLSAYLGLLIPLVGNIAGPLVIWHRNRKDSRFIDAHGKAAVNFQITSTLLFSLIAVLIPLGSALLNLDLIGLIMFVTGIVVLAFTILAWFVIVFASYIQSTGGEDPYYPFYIPFLS